MKDGYYATTNYEFNHKKEKDMKEQEEARNFRFYVNITKVAKEIGVHRNTLYNFLNGRTDTLHAYNLQKILKLKNKEPK